MRGREFCTTSPLKLLYSFVFLILLTHPSITSALTLEDFKDCSNKYQECFLIDSKPEASFYLQNTSTTKIAVLFHGLTDSAYFLKDIAISLHKDGYTVLVPLLKGHGTVPSDLHSVQYQDWIQDAQKTLELAQSLTSEKILLGGFSMGGVLATYMTQQPQWAERINALLLFGPAFQIKNSLGRAICKSNGGTIKTWAKDQEGSTPYKYQQMSFHAVCQLYEMANIVKEGEIHTPTFMALTEYDKTINSDEAFHFIASSVSKLKNILVFSKKEKEPSLSAQFVLSKEMAHTDLVFKEDLLSHRRNPLFSLMEENMHRFLVRLHN